MQRCKFRFGSYSYDIDHAKFETVLHDMEVGNNNVFDYNLKLELLKEEDRQKLWVPTGKNYSLAGFEITFRRQMLKYVVQHYLTSGLVVIVSWVSVI